MYSDHSHAHKHIPSSVGSRNEPDQGSGRAGSDPRAWPDSGPVPGRPRRPPTLARGSRRAENFEHIHVTLEHIQCHGAYPRCGFCRSSGLQGRSGHRGRVAVPRRRTGRRFWLPVVACRPAHPSLPATSRLWQTGRAAGCSQRASSGCSRR